MDLGSYLGKRVKIELTNGFLYEGIEKNEKLAKEASISWDGTNFIARIPKEFSDFLSLNEKNRKNKRMFFFAEEKDGEISHNIKIIDKEKEK